MLQSKYDKKINELEEIYYKMTSRNFGFLSEYDIPYSEISTILLIYDYHCCNIESSINFFIRDYRKIKKDDVDSLIEGLQRFLEFYTSFEGTQAVNKFIELAAQVYIKSYTNTLLLDGHKYPKLPQNPIPGSAFVDLITGFDFINYFPSLPRENIYYMIDKSKFTCRLLEIKTNKYRTLKTKIINKDVMKIEEADFIDKVGLIRLKNIFRYVPEFIERIEFVKTILSNNGIIVFQERAADNIMFNSQNQYAHIETYFEQGWLIEKIRGKPNNPLDLDTIIFKKHI